MSHLVLAGVGRLMRSGHQAEQLEEHGTLPKKCWDPAKEGQEDTRQHRQRKEGLGKTARSNGQLVGMAA